MNSQNLILLGIGLFVSLIVATAALNQYFLDEHDPMEPDGLIWRVTTAISRIKDLEAVLEINESGGEDRTIRLLLRFLKEPKEIMSIRYLDPVAVRGELFTIEGDLLSHYLPEENILVVKRWIGFPLASLKLPEFYLSQLEKDWRAGRVGLRVVQDVSWFGVDLFPCSIFPSETFSDCSRWDVFSICLDTCEENPFPSFLPGFAGTRKEGPSLSGFAGVEGALSGGSIQGGFVLEVTDLESGNLSCMIRVDRETFLVQKIVFFAEGKRIANIYMQRFSPDIGLTAEAILALPRGVEVIR